VQRAGLQRERLTQQLHRPIDVRAFQLGETSSLRASASFEAERERLLQLGHCLVVAAQPPVRAAGGAARAGEVGSGLRGVDPHQGGARGEADGHPAPGLRQHRIDPLRRRRAALRDSSSACHASPRSSR